METPGLKPMALEGIRVIDLTTGQQGPVAAALLADMGAEVFKIEEKGKGDPGRNVKTRGRGIEPTPLSYYFENNNRNKKGVALEYKTQAGREVIHRLSAKADVFVSNFPIAVLANLGFDYSTLSALNPGIVYGVGTGLGPRGPEKDKPANDITAQFLGGILSHGNRDGPVPFWGGLAEQADAILLAYGIVVALIARERTGIGQEVYSSLLGSQLTWMALNVQCSLFNGTEAGDMLYEGRKSPFYNVYKTRDDRWLCLGILQQSRDWPSLCNALDREDLLFDPRFDSDEKRTIRNNLVLREILREAFLRRTLSEWEEILNGTDLAWASLHDYSMVAADPQVLANEYVVEIEHPKLGPTKMVGVPFHLKETPGRVRTPAPDLGQHTEEVLVGVSGYDAQEMESLRRAGVI